MPQSISRPFRGPITGISLLSVVVGLGLLSLAMLGVLSLTKIGYRSVERLQWRQDIQSLRSHLLNAVDCQATFAAAGISPNSPKASCQSTTQNQIPPYLRLRRMTVLSCPTSGTETVPESCWLTPPLGPDGAAELAGWRIRATCSAEDQTLVIRAAKGDTQGLFQRDPLTRQLANWNYAKGLLFGAPTPGTSTIPLCFTPKDGGNDEWNPMRLTSGEFVGITGYYASVGTYTVPEGKTLILNGAYSTYAGLSSNLCLINGVTVTYNYWTDGGMNQAVQSLVAPLRLAAGETIQVSGNTACNVTGYLVDASRVSGGTFWGEVLNSSSRNITIPAHHTLYITGVTGAYLSQCRLGNYLMASPNMGGPLALAGGPSGKTLTLSRTGVPGSCTYYGFLERSKP